MPVGLTNVSNSANHVSGYPQTMYQVTFVSSKTFQTS